MLEYISVGLAIIAGVAGTIAFIYRHGRNAGIEEAEEERIHDEIAEIKKTMQHHAQDNDQTHAMIFKNIRDLGSKIDKLQGSSDVIKDLITNHLTKKD